MIKKNAWLQRQHKDIYARQARQSDYRSRAVYKLIEIDNKYHLFVPGQTVIELGAAPGSWSQYVSKKISAQGRLIAIDILPIAPINDRVCFIQGDITQQIVYARCLKAINNKADIIISDMLPNLSGIAVRDQARSLHLSELTLDWAQTMLRRGGDMLIKVFMSQGLETYRQQLRKYFAKDILSKPKASRAESRECYILAKCFQS